MRKIVENAREQASRAQRAARIWKALHFGLGLPAAVLAVIAGAAGLASTAGRVPAAILALCAAGLSASGIFLGAEKRAMTAEKRAAHWRTLESDACLLTAFEGSKASAAEIRNQIALLVARQEAIYLDDSVQVQRLREQGAGRTVNLTDGLALLSACRTDLHMSRWVPIDDRHPTLSSELLGLSEVDVGGTGRVGDVLRLKLYDYLWPAKPSMPLSDDETSDRDTKGLPKA